MIPFNKIITLYKKQTSDNGISWTRRVVNDVYYATERKSDINNNERKYSLTHTVVIPDSCGVSVDAGDIVCEGICSLALAENASGNAVIRSGGWEVKTASKNVYPGSGISHSWGAD